MVSRIHQVLFILKNHLFLLSPQKYQLKCLLSSYRKESPLFISNLLAKKATKLSIIYPFPLVNLLVSLQNPINNLN